jgi:DNA gyrase subunit A
VVNRQNVAAISLIGRATQGVKLVSLDKGDTVVDVARVIVDDEEAEGEEIEVDAAVPEESGDSA